MFCFELFDVSRFLDERTFSCVVAIFIVNNTMKNSYHNWPIRALKLIKLFNPTLPWLTTGLYWDLLTSCWTGLYSEPALEILFGETKIPWLWSQWKYLIPFTIPSFFPSAVSSSTPAQIPVANSVVPQNLKVPNLLPTTTLSLSLSPIACSTVRPKNI